MVIFFCWQKPYLTGANNNMYLDLISEKKFTDFEPKPIILFNKYITHRIYKNLLCDNKLKLYNGENEFINLLFVVKIKFIRNTYSICAYKLNLCANILILIFQIINFVYNIKWKQTLMHDILHNYDLKLSEYFVNHDIKPSFYNQRKILK